jgi:integrase
LSSKKLTDLFVERVKPPARGRAEYFDASFPGLSLRITEKGGKSWSVFYRLSGRLRRFTIGHYPAIKPADARREAQAALDRVRAGADPIEEKRARRDQRTPETETFGAVLEDYLERQVKPNTRKSTYLETKRAIEHDTLLKWRSRPIGSITPRDVIDLIDAIIARDARVQANRTLARLKTFFKWAAQKRRITGSPVADMELPTQERARDRVLTDDELRWLWAACDGIGWPFGPLVRLLILTAQRRDEVAEMAWPELALAQKTWTIPRERAKNDNAHEVQLCDTAVAILESLPHIGDASLIFTTTGKTPVSGFSRAKHRFDDAMLVAKRKELGKQKGDAIPDWTLHDLRRTATTGMARLKIPPHVVDRILNHTSGTIRGVAAVYNRFAYLDERRAALEAWARYVDNLVAPAPANVVQLRG